MNTDVKKISGQLNDFDWQLNLSLSSDKLATINQPMATVDLEIATNRSDEPISLASVEMNNVELDQLIAKLEQAAQALEQAKT